MLEKTEENKMHERNTLNINIATFGAGCFWGVEETFRKLDGVEETAVGYMGGSLDKPTYEDVCTDKTGHAEVVQIKYDPEKITYDELLEIFWECHDPTELNRQGPDIGTQYRSAVFYNDEDQKRVAEESKETLVKSGKEVVTAVVPAGRFWPAEEYHQKYIQKQGGSSCHVK